MKMAADLSRLGGGWGGEGRVRGMMEGERTQEELLLLLLFCCWRSRSVQACQTWVELQH